MHRSCSIGVVDDTTLGVSALKALLISVRLSGTLRSKSVNKGQTQDAAERLAKTLRTSAERGASMASS